MKWIFVVLLFLAAGCAGPSNSGTTYERGTFTAPPPAAVRPGVGAPVVGQPGTPAGYPRGTDARVLPPRSEPTIFASDKPAHPRSAPEIAGAPIVLPVDKLGRQPMPTGCVDAVNDTLKGIGLYDKVKNTREGRQCIVAEMYAACVELFANESRREQQKQYQREVYARIRRKHVAPDTTPTEEEEAAAALVKRDCSLRAKGHPWVTAVLNSLSLEVARGR